MLGGLPAITRTRNKQPSMPEDPKKKTDHRPPLRTGETAVPVKVTLLIPMSAATAGDVDSLKEDAIQLVKSGRLTLDGIRIRHRLDR